MMKMTMLAAGFAMAAGAAAAQESFQYATQVPSGVRSDPKMNVLHYQFKKGKTDAVTAGDVMIDRAVGVMCEASSQVGSAPADAEPQLQHRCAALSKDLPVEWKKAGTSPVDPKDIVKRTLHERGTQEVLEISEQKRKDTLNSGFNIRAWNVATRGVCLYTLEGIFEPDGAFTHKTSQFWGCHTISNRNSYFDSLLERLNIGFKI